MDSKSIGQGYAFQHSWNTFYQNVASTLKTDTHSPLIEGNTTMNDAGENDITTEEQDVKEKRKEFEEAYKDYSDKKEQVDTLRKRYLNIINQNKKIPDDVQEYLNSVVRYNNQYYYITPFGYRREFQEGSENISETCGVPGETHEHRTHFEGFFWGEQPASSPPANSTPKSEYRGEISAKIFNKLQVGEPMRENTPCGYEGQVVSHLDSYAWVTPDGVRKNFESQNDFENNDTCPDESKSISFNEFNNMIIGEVMSSDIPCSTFINDSELESELVSATSQLQVKTNILLDKYKELIQSDKKFIQDMKGVRGEFEQIIAEIQEQIKLDKHLFLEDKTSQGQWQDQVVNERMQYYQYVGLLGLTLLIGGATIYHLRRK